MVTRSIRARTDANAKIKFLVMENENMNGIIEVLNMAIKLGKAELARVNKEHVEELARVNKEHGEEMARLKKEHGAELARLKKEQGEELELDCILTEDDDFPPPKRKRTAREGVTNLVILAP